MPSDYSVVWTTSAENDLNNIIEFIAKDSPASALKILKKIKDKLGFLNDFPERCRYCQELYNIGIDKYRELIINPWRILFRIEDKMVYIISLLDSRRDLESLIIEKT